MPQCHNPAILQSSCAQSLQFHLLLVPPHVQLFDELEGLGDAYEVLGVADEIDDASREKVARKCVLMCACVRVCARVLFVCVRGGG